MLRGSPHGTVAAVPLFSFWLGLMVSIWLFLLGVARIFGGTFSAIEITLTVIIGAASAFGMIAAMRRPTRLGLVRRVATAVLFSVIQFASFWFSMQPCAAFR